MRNNKVAIQKCNNDSNENHQLCRFDAKRTASIIKYTNVRIKDDIYNAANGFNKYID